MSSIPWASSWEYLYLNHTNSVITKYFTHSVELIMQRSINQVLQNKAVRTALYIIPAIAFMSILQFLIFHEGRLDGTLGQISGAAFMFILLLLTQRWTKEEIALYIFNIKWLGVLIPFILATFLIIAKWYPYIPIPFLSGICFFNMIYFGRIMFGESEPSKKSTP